jgi:hypothetical protein
VHPIPRLLLATRSLGALALLGGALLVVIGCVLPASEFHVANARSRLDEFMPSYQFNEVHRIHIAAPPERVYRAMRDVRAGEIYLFKLLTTIRRFGRRGPESILNAPDEMPILDVATKTTFCAADDPPREYVSGTIVEAPKGWKRCRSRPGGIQGARAQDLLWPRSTSSSSRTARAARCFPRRRASTRPTPRRTTLRRLLANH